MPFCEDCAKYWAPSAMREDGACPTCERVLEALAASSRVSAKNIDVRRLAAGEDGEPAKAPWHFKLLMVLLAAYLAWRVVQLFV